MKKLRPPIGDSNYNAQINMPEIGGEDLYHVDEEPPTVVEEVGEVDEEQYDSDLEGINGPERLRRDGEHEPEVLVE